MKSVLSKLSEYSGESFDLLDFGKLSESYAAEIKAAEERDENRMRSYYEPDNTMDKLSMLREKLAQQAEEEASEVDGDLPVMSTFDLHNDVKRSMESNKRDAGLKALYAHAKRLWEKDRTGSVDYATFSEIRDHYSARFPKSAAVDCLEKSAANGYVKLDMTKLMGIAASIKDQDDFDYMIRVNGLSVNNPQNKKARDFILEMVNKRAQMEGWDPEQYENFSNDESNKQWTADQDLIYAVNDADVELVSHLLEQGASPAAENGEAFRTALSKGYSEIIDLFEQHGFTEKDFREVYPSSFDDKAKDLGISTYSEDELLGAVASKTSFDWTEEKAMQHLETIARNAEEEGMDRVEFAESLPYWSDIVGVLGEEAAYGYLESAAGPEAADYSKEIENIAMEADIEGEDRVDKANVTRVWSEEIVPSLGEEKAIQELLSIPEWGSDEYDAYAKGNGSDSKLFTGLY